MSAAVLFESRDPKVTGESTALWDQRLPCQVAFMNFLTNIFKYSAAAGTYSVRAEDHPRLPLFADDKNNPLINSLGIYVITQSLDWKGLKVLQPSSAADVDDELLGTFPEHHSAVPGLCSSCFKISKEFVAYLEGFVGASPYYDVEDPNIRLNTWYNKAAKRFSYVTDVAWRAYVGRRIKEWYAKYPPNPPAARGPTSSNAEGDGAVEGDEGGAAEAGPAELFSLDAD